MRALKRATDFAGHLDGSLGDILPISHHASEIEALERALNVVSARLLRQNTDLINQKFALDQHAIVSITDLRGTIIYANAKFCDVNGFTQDELLGQNHRIVKSDEHSPDFYKTLWHTISQGRVWHGDIKNRTKDGCFYWANATIVPLLGSDGLPFQYIGIRTDITANKMLEESLQIANRQAQSATVAKGQFLANMSHEIRTPMNAVLGMLKLLQNTDLTVRQLDYADKAERAAHSLMGLINDILDFSKIDAGKLTLDIHPFRLDKLLRDLSVILSANVGKKPVEVLFDIDPSLPRSLIGDDLRLQQVLLNLSSNAVKFTEKGEVVIRVRLLEHQITQARLEFSVRDTGIGISADYQKRIFEGFSQAESSNTRRFGGTGLGLSISRSLVDLMGGNLTLHSVSGQGSTFNFDITLAMDTTPAATPSHVHQLIVNGLSVLVVDDNATAREVLTAMAQSLGWHVDVASSGLEALALLQTRQSDGQAVPYQAMFIDWQMPGMDGWETIAKIQELIPDSPAPIVVMVTAYGRDMLAQRTPQERATLHGFLVKPITASMLFDAVADALSSRQIKAVTTNPVADADKPLQGMRLLVVEDNLINQQVAQELLSDRGAEVTIAGDGQQGVDAVRRAIDAEVPFDAVLMDIQMPVMDGYTATRVLREEMGLSQLPIIAMTANAMASDRDACLAAGMNEHVGKPFDVTRLSVLLASFKSAANSTAVSISSDTTVGLSEVPLVLPVSRYKPIEIPKVDEVDVVGALERFGGNEALYARILQSYLSDIRQLPDKFEQTLAQNELLAATSLVHTLKGLSATVGASYLAAVALQTEITLKSAVEDGISAADLNILCVKLRQAISLGASVMERVSRRCTSSQNNSRTDTPTVISADSTVALLTELRTLLLASDMRAFDVFETLNSNVRKTLGHDKEVLAAAMSAFDFVLAAQVCTKLIQNANEAATST
jgi:PAS domain S-box-containing protein